MIAFAGTTPTAEALAELHDRAHDLCFIANSVKTHVTVEQHTSQPVEPAADH